ncbi:NAD(P)H-dependent oxidoreductase [Helcococcus ovis]|uniref:NADPH-dependent oxidoreductase n=1 Tax=Helcococcus ovis TaxID=72026 RepID=A0A4R9C1J7_9FIRM|nr:NAD(P)H-dependent oxidoreductase [Helcococcus ovis]TFF64954.1 NADPH-dependent oxidoreductase [Helcococcus ovis]TFF65297.1 NADPH-dependent oxidoreductase [Helcococcus ovis]
MIKLVGIIGTNNQNSTNRKLLEYIQTQFFYKVDVELIEIKDVPLIGTIKGDEIPEIVMNISNKIEKSDGVIIATPEYDHSPTASLLNLLSWLSYKIHPLYKKPVMIVGASYGALGSSRAQYMLRQILKSPELEANVLSSEYLLPYSKKAFDDMGDLRGRDKIREMENIFDEFLAFVDFVNKSNAENLINIHDFDNFKWDSIKEEE